MLCHDIFVNNSSFMHIIFIILFNLFSQSIAKTGENEFG